MTDAESAFQNPAEPAPPQPERRPKAPYYPVLTGQPALEVLASSEREFFYTAVNARLVFEVESAGRATAVVLYQNGQTPRAPRID